MARFKNGDEYFELYPVDANDEWVNSAYDEEGNAVVCDICGCEMKWNPDTQLWYCLDCEQEMDRPTYFNHIGAEPPGSICMTNCRENYPFCKKYCEHYEIDLDDPIL